MDLKKVIVQKMQSVSQTRHIMGERREKKRKIHAEPPEKLHKIQRNSWRTSRVLRTSLVLTLCVAMTVGAFEGTKMVQSASQMRCLQSTGVSPEKQFVESDDFANLMDSYLQLFQVYMELSRVVAPEGLYHEEMPFLYGTKKGQDMTLKELGEKGLESYDYTSYIDNYLRDFQEYHSEGYRLLSLTEQIRSLESMVVWDDGKVYYTPKAYQEIRQEDKKELSRRVEDLSEQMIYQGQETVLTDFGEETEEYHKEAEEKQEISLLKTKVKVKPQNTYQKWIFEKYPEFANAYMKTLFAKAYEEDFTSEKDGIDYLKYKAGFHKDYRKYTSMLHMDVKDFYVEKSASSQTLGKKNYLCYYDKETGETKRFSEDQSFETDYGEKMPVSFLIEMLQEDEEGFQDTIYGLYLESPKKYAEQLQAQGEREIEQLSLEEMPWNTQIVPYSMQTAQAYAGFLMSFYQELRTFFEKARFSFYFEGGDVCIAGNGIRGNEVEKIKNGEYEKQGDTQNENYLYGCYSSDGSVFQTNLPRTCFGSGELSGLLKQAGDAMNQGNSYVCMVSLNISGKRMYDKVDNLSAMQEQFEIQQKEYQEYEQQLVNSARGVAIAFVFILFSLLLLLVMCGHQKEKEVITLLPWDKIWTEVILLTDFCAAILFFEIVEELQCNISDWEIISYAYEWIWNIVFPCILSLLALFAAWSLLSLVKRIKAGKLWATSFLFKVFQCGKNSVCRLGGCLHELPAGKRYLAFLIYNIAGGFLLCLLIVSGELEYNEFGFSVFCLGVLCILTVDGLYFVRSLRNALADERIRQGAQRIAQGELSYQIQPMKKISKEQAQLIEVINHIGEGLEHAVEESVRSERMKTELITNVSHDIKTPLTSVINYVDLLKREQIDNEKAKEYLEVLDAKSQRLKVLIEDLVEASKASSGALELQITTLNFKELVLQTNGEFEEKFAQNNLQLMESIPHETVCFRGDGRRVYRILENLYGNVAKYAMPGTRVYVDLSRKEDRAEFTIKNISRDALGITPEELTERFVRGEQSRTTEGSGLGLSIAKSLTELMHGEFIIHMDGDLFRVTVSFPADGETAISS